MLHLSDESFLIRLKEQYGDLVKSLGNQDNMTPGKMLFLALDNLFNNIQTEIEATRHLINESDQTKTDLGFVAKRVMIVKDLFSSCFLIRSCFKGEKMGLHLPTGDDLGRCVEIFIKDFDQQVVRSLIQRVMVSVAKDLEDETLNSDKDRFLTLELNNLKNVVTRLELAKQYELQIEVLQSNQLLSQLMRTSFQWFYEDDLPKDSVTFAPPGRQTFLADLKNRSSVLAMTNDELLTIQTKFEEHYSSVEQRLKWACGANSELQQLFDEFNTTYLEQLDKLKTMTSTVRLLVGVCNALLHLEVFRTKNGDTINADAAFMTLLSTCQQSAALQETQEQDLTDQELCLFKLNAPKGDKIDKAWIRSTMEAAATAAKAVKAKVLEESESVKKVEAEIRTGGAKAVQVIGRHQKLMSDVGALLRTISKSEDYEVPEVRKYLSNYKTFSEHISTLVKTCGLDVQSDQSIKDLTDAIDSLKECMDDIFDKVIDFSNTFKDENLEAYKVRKNEDGLADPEESGRIQASSVEEKNAFAMNVLNRIRNKLEGREPNALRKASVEEQVDFIIREATSQENLAFMYEGWTAWI